MGSQGPEGPQGSQGPQGTAGSDASALPDQANHANHVLATDATSPSWRDVRAVLATGDDEGFVVQGTYGTPTTPPATGSGARMMWYPQRAAFRVGRATGAEWDDAATGNDSYAFGVGVAARGDHSIAMGLDSGTSATATSAVAMGEGALALAHHATAIGNNTQASGVFATALGQNTTASGDFSTAIGTHTTASGTSATAMGNSTTASGLNSIAGGSLSTASGYAAVALGDGNSATGDHSLALGDVASTNNHTGSFVYADVAGGPFSSSVDNEVAMRAAGGFRLLVDNSGHGCTMTAASPTWSCTSDVAAKTDFRDADADDTLRRIASLPIRSWRFKAELGSARHIGPTAQDFRSAFGLGNSDKAIAMVDAEGVSLLAIQALARRTEHAEQRAEAVERENAELRARLGALERSVDKLTHAHSR